jgi:hypothetical protein
VSTYDQITTGASAGKYGRVLRISGLDAGAYRVQEVYNFFSNPLPAGVASVPLRLENFLGRPWVGMWHGVNTIDPQVARIVPTGEDTWGLDKITTITHATFYSLTPDDVLTLEFTGSGGVAVSPTGFIASAIFQSKLYVSYFADGASSKVYQFDGTTWATVLNGSTLSGYSLRADGAYLYAFSGIPSTTTHSFLATSEGTVWVDKSANFTGTVSGHGDFNVSAPASNLLMGFEQ